MACIDLYNYIIAYCKFKKLWSGKCWRRSRDLRGEGFLLVTIYLTGDGIAVRDIHHSVPMATPV